MTPLEAFAEFTAATAAAKVLADRLKALEPSIAALVPVVEDPPISEPPEPGPVEPPVPPTVVHNRTLNLARMVYFEPWTWGVPYERAQSLITFKGKTGKITLCRRTFIGGEKFQPERTYTAMVLGLEVPVAFALGQQTASATFPLDSITVDEGELDVKGLDDGETCPLYFARISRPGAKYSDRKFVCTGSYDVTQTKWAYGEHSWAYVPANPVLKPEPRPSQRYTKKWDDTTPMRAELLLPGDVGTQRHTVQTDDGYLTGFGIQAYYYDKKGLEGFPTPLGMTAGDRGLGLSAMITSILIGHATQTEDPNSAPRYNLYCTEPNRYIRVTDAGQITTLFGYQHRGIPSYPGNTANLELVGDWSAIAEKERGIHEAWGSCSIASTLLIDTSADPIPTEENRRPHLIRPEFLVTDPQHNRILRGQAPKDNHTDPYIVTVFATGNDLWDVIEWRGPNGDEYIASERGANRIIAFDKTGKYLRTIIERDASLPGDAHVSSDRICYTSGTAAQIEAQPCLGPEGLAMDSADTEPWLYFGTLAQKRTTRVHLITGKWEVHRRPALGRSRFLKIAVHGGYLFPMSWSNAYPGTAATSAIKPDGTIWKYAEYVPFHGTGYGCAVAANAERIYFSTSAYGMVILTPGEPVDMAKYGEGRTMFEAMKGPLIWGNLGYFGGLSNLPWGAHPSLDYFLTAVGHIKEAA